MRLGPTLRSERGVALPLALGVLIFLTVSIGAVIALSSSGARDAGRSEASGVAYNLAEAGLAEAFSILENAADPTVVTLPATTRALEEGQVTFSGTYAAPMWTITSVGSVRNPTGGDDITRTLTQTARVQPLVAGATAPEWDRLFHNDTSTCLTIDTVTVPASVTSRGDLCLEGTGKITGSRSKVEVGQAVTIDSPNGRIGDTGSEVSRAEVIGTCTYGSQPAHTPCTSADHVYATTYTTTPPNLTKPEVDMAYWYQNAKPGPKHYCTSGDFPGGFDNDTVWNRSLPDYGNDNEDIDQVTPTNDSYSCKYEEDGELKGEISWDHVTHVLKIHGTIFIDGNVRFDKDGQLVNYQGRAIIYAAGDLEYDEVVCAGGDGTNNCHDGDMSDWNPEENMMIILSGGWSEYDQGEETLPNGELKPAAFQGVMYARDECLIHQDFRSSGPILCDRIRIEYSGDWPTFYSWPPLQTLIAGQMYGSFATAEDYALIVGDEIG